jgi:DNA-binding FadR family transcriptional regulator
VSDSTSLQRAGRNLVAGAVESIRNRILRGRLAAGSQLPSQGQLCADLGVSRSVVREAMQILQSQGLIEISQGKRPRVLPAGPQAAIGTLSTLIERTEVSLVKLLEVRRPLEVEIAGLAALRGDPRHFEQLRAAVDELSNSDDFDGEIAADMRFHKALAESSGNPLFGILLDVLAEMLRESRRLTLRRSGVEMALMHHERILAAVTDGDQDRARAAMADHMAQTLCDIETAARQSDD